MNKNITLNGDAFAQGQVVSKIWLCEHLEQLATATPHEIHILGGWYGVQAFLLLSRNKLPISRIKSYDIDPACEAIADCINNTWVFEKWKFKAFTEDVNTLDYENATIIINTSTEHMESGNWFNRIPEGTLVALQGNDMNHDDHTSEFTCLADFEDRYPLRKTLFKGERKFEYPDWSFSRFMLIGYK